MRAYTKQFAEAKKAEYESWKDNEVFDLVDLRKTYCKSFVTGRWVVTFKRDKEGKFLKCKARWVLRGFQDRQKDYQQTDSPTATRPGFRLTCQVAAPRGWSIHHIDLKTAFLQGEEYDLSRDVVCQIPPEAGLPDYMGARLKKPAYGVNDATRRWRNRIDGGLQAYGMIPARADRCAYVFYAPSRSSGEAKTVPKVKLIQMTSEGFDMDSLLELILDPITGSPATHKQVMGIACLHVDDLFTTGAPEFHKSIVDRIRKDYQVGSEDKDDIVFTGQRLRWQGKTLVVDQDRAIEELAEIPLDKGLKDETPCALFFHPLKLGRNGLVSSYGIEGNVPFLPHCRRAPLRLNLRPSGRGEDA